MLNSSTKHRVRMRQSTECDTILIRLAPKWLRKYVYQSILCELKESVIVHKSVHGVLCVELRVVAERGSRKLLTRAHHQEEDPSLLITLFPRESTVCELGMEYILEDRLQHDKQNMFSAELRERYPHIHISMAS